MNAKNQYSFRFELMGWMGTPLKSLQAPIEYYTHTLLFIFFYLTIL
jgi:hypothetical protein